MTVKDTKGAVVQNAAVTAGDQARGIERTVTTSTAEGQYVFLTLPPGLYAVRVEAPGFAKTVTRDVRLLIGHVEELSVP